MQNNSNLLLSILKLFDISIFWLFLSKTLLYLFKVITKILGTLIKVNRFLALFLQEHLSHVKSTFSSQDKWFFKQFYSICIIWTWNSNRVSVLNTEHL